MSRMCVVITNRSNHSEFLRLRPWEKIATPNTDPHHLAVCGHVDKDIEMTEMLNEYFASALTVEAKSGIDEVSPAQINVISFK